MFFLYNLGLCLAAPILLPLLAIRSLRGKFPGLAQRVGAGLTNLSVVDIPTVWIHAVSLGEVNSAAVLIEDSKKRIPEIRFIITSSTRTGWNAARRLAKDGDVALYPPLDLPFVCRRFLRRIRPNALIVFETELWPNLFREAKRAGCTLIVTNGRISDRSFPRYWTTRALWQTVLTLPDAIFAQSARDAERFKLLGAPRERVSAIGNLKFAGRPKASAFAEELREAVRGLGGSPVVVAGSTMPGEEEMLLDAFQSLLSKHPTLWMILAPRHPERFAEVQAKIKSRGISPQLRSQWKRGDSPITPGVLLLDSMGDLSSMYEFATVAFVGGTLVPTGGHNILEPASFGRPIVVGPHMENFQEIADEFLQDAESEKPSSSSGIRIGSIAQVSGPEGMLEAFRLLLRDRAFASRIGSAAMTLWNAKRAGTKSILDEIHAFLPNARRAPSSPAGRGKDRESAVAARETL